MKILSLSFFLGQDLRGEEWGSIYLRLYTKLTTDKDSTLPFGTIWQNWRVEEFSSSTSKTPFYNSFGFSFLV